MHLSPQSVGLGKGVRWVDGAVSRNHMFLIDSKGGVWGVGNNATGQLGLVRTHTGGVQG